MTKEENSKDKKQKRTSVMFYDFSEPWIDWAIKVSKVLSSFNKHRPAVKIQQPADAPKK